MATIANLVSYELKGVKESFANWISNISPTDTPFVSMTSKEKVQNKYFQWQEDTLGAVQSNNAFAEGSDADATTLAPTSVRKNVTQIMRKVVQVSDTASSLASYGRGKELQYQMEKAAKELKRDIEWALLNNTFAYEGNGPLPQDYRFSDDVEIHSSLETSYPGQPWNTGTHPLNGARRTAGFRGLVAPKGQASVEDPEAIVHANSTTKDVLTEEDIFKITKALYLAGAKATHIMFHPKHAQFFSGLTERAVGGAATRIMMFDGSVDTKVNKYVSCLVDPLGQRFCLIPNRFMPQNSIYFFNPSDWTQKILREPGAQMLAKTGSFDKYMIEIELGLQHKNQYASGVLDLSAPSIEFTIDTGATLTQTGHTLEITAASGAADFDVTVNNNENEVAAGSVVPDTTVVDFEDLDKEGFTVVVNGDGKTTGTIEVDGEVFTVNVTIGGSPAVVKPKTVTVKGTGVAAGKVTLGSTTGTVQLSVDVTPTTATDKTVTWSSADDNTASVSAAGLVTGKKAGKVVITATANGDNTVKGTVEVTVPSAAPAPIAIAAGGAQSSIYDAGTKTATFTATSDVLTLTPTPAAATATLEGADKAKFTWTAGTKTIALNDDTASATATLKFSNSGNADTVVNLVFTKAP